MKLKVHDIEEGAKRLVFEEPTDGLNDLLVHGAVRDFDFPAVLAVRLDHYRAGQELFFHGRVSGDIVGHCARCLEEYVFLLDNDFDVVLVPQTELLAEEVALTGGELDLSVYEGDEIDVSPIIREQVILALPTRPLCDYDCKGLCPRCGVNLNLESCRCAVPSGDPRLAVLKNIKVGH